MGVLRRAAGARIDEPPQLPEDVVTPGRDVVLGIRNPEIPALVGEACEASRRRDLADWRVDQGDSADQVIDVFSSTSGPANSAPDIRTAKSG